MHSSEKNKAKTRFVMLDASAHEVCHVIEKFRFHKQISTAYIYTSYRCI